MTIDLFIKTEAQRNWLHKLAQLQQKIEATAQQHDEEAIFPLENIELLKSIGYTKATLPKEYGGDGFNIYDALLLQETTSKFDGSTGLITAWTLMNVGELFENRYWEPSTLHKFGEAVAGGAIINKAVSEYAMGSPLRGGRPGTTAKRQGDKWIINGRKNYTTGSHALDYFLTLVWVEEDAHTAFFLIPKTAKGVSIEETWDVVSMKSTGSHDLVLENVEVDAEALVEIPSYSTGFKLNSWLLLIPATYLGIAQAARDYAVHFANTHSPNSIEGTIAQLPNVQTLIGEIELSLLNARFALYGAAEACLDPNRQQLANNAINAAKHIVTNAAVDVVDKAMRVVGAKSLQRTNPLQRYYRDVRAGLHNPPMDDITIKNLAFAALQLNK
ncbi:MAG: acyl-CoA dehydrogenase family protein [Solibacillus sp.]